MNLTKLFEIDNGIGIDGGVSIASDGASPLLLTPPNETLFLENRGVAWFYNSGWRFSNYLGSLDSHEVVYNGDNIASVIYKKSSIKVFQIDLTYVSDLLTIEEQSLFASNGTTLVRKVTYNYSYTGDQLTGLTKVET